MSPQGVRVRVRLSKVVEYRRVAPTLDPRLVEALAALAGAVQLAQNVRRVYQEIPTGK